MIAPEDSNCFDIKLCVFFLTMLYFNYHNLLKGGTIMKRMKLLFAMFIISLIFSINTSNIKADDDWSYENWNMSYGKLISQSDSKWIIKMNSIGGGIWESRVTSNFTITPPITTPPTPYRLSFKISSSDCNKWVYYYVGANSLQPICADWLYLPKGQTITYTKDMYLLNSAKICFGIGGEFGNNAYIDSQIMYSYATTKPKDGDPSDSTTITCSNFSFEPITNADSTSIKDKKSSDIITKLGKSSIKKVTRKGKNAKITLKKISNAQSYQIKYSTSKNFKSKQTKTVKTKKTSYTIKKLKKNTKYYVKSRAYSKYSENTIYGSWSKTKTIPKK